MRVFLAGASGVIGRPLIAALVGAGHEVTGMTRREERRAEIDAAGAVGVVCDVFDSEALTATVSAARPEVVVHELTALPAKLDVREKGVYDANNRIRTEGTRNLVAAAQAAGARRMVAQSIAFVYAPVGGPVKSEEDPVMEAEGEFGAAVAAAMELERRVTEAEGIEGLVLRYGFFYGPGSSYAADGHQADEVRRRRFPIVGGGRRACSRFCTSTTPRRRPWRRASAASRASTTSATTIRRRCANGCRCTRGAVGAKRPMRVPKLIARHGRRRGRGRASRPRCAAPRTRRQSESSAGSRGVAQLAPGV